MDPDACLAELRQLCTEQWTADDELGETGLATADYRAERMAELIEALDEWIGRGGFLPEAWRKAQQRERDRKDSIR